MRANVVPASLLLLILLSIAGSAHAVVLHTDSFPADRPSDAWVGRWNDNGRPPRGSVVPVGPNYVLTARHINPGGGEGTTIVIAGQSYRVVELFDHAEADLRLARIARADGQPAELATWAPLYVGTREMSAYTVFGGYGKGRGDPLVDNGKTYGYAWSGADNSTLRWGENRIEGIDVATVQSAGTTTHVLLVDFDGPGGTYVAEAGLAEWDSGGGWFVRDGGTWALAGMSLYAEPHVAGAISLQQSWFDDPTTPQKDPDIVAGARVSAYVGFIEGVLALRRFPGDADEDGVVGLADLAILASSWNLSGGWDEGDFTGDGQVDLADLGVLASHWNQSAPGVAAPADALSFAAALQAYPSIPEPASLALVTAGAAAGIWSRRRHP